MITPKQRASLRALANALEPSMQIGKGELKETSFVQIEQMLEAKELIKIRVLKNMEKTPREICNEIVEKIGCEPVHVIGNIICLYKKSTKKGFAHIEF